MKIYNGGNSICGNQVKNFCTNVVFIEWSFLEAGGGRGGLGTGIWTLTPPHMVQYG